MFSLWLAAALAGDPASPSAGSRSAVPVVALGDAWVATDAAPGGWVAVLADCLEERAKGRYSVVDRATTGQDPDAARKSLGPVLDLSPGLVLVGVSPPKSVAADRDALKAFEDALTSLSRDITARGAVTLLVGVVEPSGGKYDAVVEHVAKGVPGVVHVDLTRDWPDGERGALTTQAWLNDQGHARIGAAACDAVIASTP